MVGYDPSAPQNLSPIWHSTAGVLSGFITRFLCQPLDVLKIRFQLQHEPLKFGQSNYYWGMSHALRRIWEEESVRALWKGHLPAQLLSGVYGLGQFPTFEVLTKIAHLKLDPGWSGAHVDFICGSIAGAMGTVISMPCDTIRTRLVGQGEPKIYTGLLNAASTMLRTEGPLSFYKGLSPSLLAIMPQTGVQFAVFRFLSQEYWSTDTLAQSQGSKKLPWNISLLFGTVAGIISKTTVYPLDLSKKRLQVQGFEQARIKFGQVTTYSGLGNCLWQTLRDEGISGLYKGLGPSLIKAGITSGLTFGLYEEIIHAFILLKL